MFTVDVWLQMAAAVYMLLLSALVLSCSMICGQMFGDDLNKESEDSDWRDPTDMINYDLASGKMRNSEVCAASFFCISVITVSYTHLTLPTKRIV